VTFLIALYDKYALGFVLRSYAAGCENERSRAKGDLREFCAIHSLAPVVIVIGAACTVNREISDALATNRGSQSTVRIRRLS
jgi:hypothetical protein